MPAMALLAEGILKLHWDQTVPVNLAHIVKQMGVKLELQPQLGCSARLRICQDKQAHITLEAELPKLHQRYAVAQSLGHIALHHFRPGMEHAVHIGADFRLDYSHRYTTEANDFALRLLMPEPALRYAIDAMHARSEEEIAHVFAVPTLFVKQRLADMQLKLPRAVATPAMRGFTIALD